jgi:hypothetical protein
MGIKNGQNTPANVNILLLVAIFKKKKRSLAGKTAISHLSGFWREPRRE